MLQAVWFDAGPADAGRLLLVIHHLAVDGVSWRILVEDLAAAWSAIAGGHVAVLAPVATSFRGWALRLAGEARARRGELAFWKAMLDAPSLTLVEGALDPDRDRRGDAGQLTLRLPGAVTAALLERVPAAFHCGIQDVLLGALALAAVDWCRRRQRGSASAVLVDVEGHGREEIFAGLDLSRTVGWFTSLFPVRLDAGGIDAGQALADGRLLGGALKRVKEQLRALPGHGIGYGLLRYLDRESAAQLDGHAAPQLGFNYLGRFAAPLRRAGLGGSGRGAGAGRRRRSGDAARPCAGGQCADA